MTRRNLYPLTGRTEPDMRVELNRFMDGSYPEIAKGQIGVLRKMRRDTNGDLIDCACVDAVTHEPDKDHFCPYCAGEGFYWDESFIDIYKIDIGNDPMKARNEQLISPTLMNIPFLIFYLKSSVDLTNEDKIVELVLNSEGVPVRPYKRQGIYRIGTLSDMRSDRGRLEYWIVYAYKEEIKFLNGPEG